MIGLSEKDCPLNKQLGSTKRSYGYKSDGKIFNNKASSGEDYGAKFEKGDTVGCGLHLSSRQIFFTLNGRYLGFAFKDVDLHALYPSVCLQSLSDEVQVTFSPTKSEPFMFDLEDYRNTLLRNEFAKVQEQKV